VNARKHKWILPALGPLAVGLALGAMIWHSGRQPKQEAAKGEPAAKAASRDRSTRLDISSLATDASLAGWESVQGSFRLVELEGRTVLELGPEPMEEGRLVWSRLLAGRGTVRARMWGARTRRNAPRFALGLVASSSFVWLRVMPLESTIKIVGREEQVLASAPWSAVSERPLWLELAFRRSSAPATGSRVEARVWFEGEERPEAPTLEADVAEELALARAAVAGAPYALKPIYFDFLEVDAE
jgi:hypothetical protein